MSTELPSTSSTQSEVGVAAEMDLAAKIDPLPPQHLQHPELHLLGCLPPHQLHHLGHCWAGYLLPGHKQKGHKQQHLDLDLDLDIDLQVEVEDNWVKNGRTCSGT